MLRKSLLVLFLSSCVIAATDLTFKNVSFVGYMDGWFSKTIPLSNSLKDFMPQSACDKIVISSQNVPVLYEDSLADLNLNELVLEYCRIQEIRSGTLKNVPKLRTLALKGNRIETIKEGVFNNLQLSTIDLSWNSITDIHSNALNDLPNLQHVDLRHNNIRTWDNDWFKNTPLITTLNMQNNFISELPNNAFKNVISSRKISGGQSAISIFLSCNKIETIKREAFNGLIVVNQLWLDHNWLTSDKTDFLDYIRFDDVRLDHNFHCYWRYIRFDSMSRESSDGPCSIFGSPGWWALRRQHREYCSGRSADDEYESYRRRTLVA